MGWKWTPSGPTWDDNSGLTREQAEEQGRNAMGGGKPPPPAGPPPQTPGGAAGQFAFQAGQDEDYYRSHREGLQPQNIEQPGWGKDQSADALANEAARRRMQQANQLALDAANGARPSAAETLARGQIQAGRNAQVAMAQSARGGAGAQAAALRNAANVGSQMDTAGNNQIAALRADEMAQAREDYLRGTRDLTAAANQSRNRSTQYASTLMGAHAQQRQTELERNGLYLGAESGAAGSRLGAIGEMGAAKKAERDANRQRGLDFARTTGVVALGPSSDITRKSNVAPEGQRGRVPGWLRQALGMGNDPNAPKGGKDLDAARAAALRISAGLEPTKEDASKRHGLSTPQPSAMGWRMSETGPTWATGPEQRPNTAGDWQRADMALEEASGEGERKRGIYMQAREEQDELQRQRRAAARFAGLSPEERSPFANDEYRDAFAEPGRYDGATLRRRAG